MLRLLVGGALPMERGVMAQDCFIPVLIRFWLQQVSFPYRYVVVLLSGRNVQVEDGWRVVSNGATLLRDYRIPFVYDAGDVLN